VETNEADVGNFARILRAPGGSEGPITRLEREVQMRRAYSSRELEAEITLAGFCEPACAAAAASLLANFEARTSILA